MLPIHRKCLSVWNYKKFVDQKKEAALTQAKRELTEERNKSAESLLWQLNYLNEQLTNLADLLARIIPFVPPGNRAKLLDFTNLSTNFMPRLGVQLFRLTHEAPDLSRPAGTYKLKFEKFFLENIEVKVGQPIEILLGAIVYPGVNRRVAVYSQDSKGDFSFQKGYVGTLSPEATTLEVPAGTYKLKFEKFFLENIVVKSGKETVLKR